MVGVDPILAWAQDLIVSEPVLGSDEKHALGVLQRVCRAATGAVGAAGVGVSLVSAAGKSVVAASDAIYEVVEELQFVVGEGPCLAAFESGSPVLVSDLVQTGGQRWPGYAAAALNLGVRAVFAFPMQAGAARLGALDVYMGRAGPLTAQATSRAMAFAQVAVETLLDERLHVDTDGNQRSRGTRDDSDDAAEDLLQSKIEMYQAQGMVMVQLSVTLDEAMSLMRAQAYSQNRSVAAVAADVVAQRLLLQIDPP